MSDVSPLSGISGLSFDSTLLSLVLLFCRPVTLSAFFLPADTFSRLFFLQDIPQYFSLGDRLLYGGGMNSMLPHGTGICHNAFI